jgi:TolB-like protein/tetratricopeptide (TPR) repeat protein
MLRRVLGDSAGGIQIETVPRRGYRFLAEVRTVDSVQAPTGGDTARRSTGTRWIRWSLAAVFLLAVSLSALGIGSRRDGPPVPPRSVAVLPFKPLIAESRDEALEVGLAEAVIVKLGQFGQLRVPSIHAVQHYSRSQPDPLLAGRDLGVEAVLDGSLLRVNGSVRLSARLLDVASGSTRWARQWDFPWTDIFTVQDAMAAEVSRALTVSLAAADTRPLRGHPTNVAAYEAYLRARYLLLRRTLPDSRRAAELLEEAVRLDPQSGAAYASLGFAYLSITLLEGPATPFVELGRQAAQRALALDPTIAEAHAVLGRIKIHFDWDAEAGDREMRRALELDPTNPFVLHCYSLVLADDGRFEEALTLADRALAQDPASVLANRDKAVVLLLAQRYEECVEQCRRTLELDPYAAFAHDLLGLAYERLNRPEQAVEAYITPLTFSEKNSDLVAALRAAAARGGSKAFWERRLQALLEEADPRPFSVAAAYVRLGDRERALAWLQKLYDARGGRVRALKTHPEWDPLRADPRFKELLRRANMGPVLDSPLSRHVPQ